MRPPWKVGQLAQRTGLSVRTLHWYDEIDLLKPSYHSDSGHRLYTPEDVVRLQRIISLRQLGFALEEVRTCLENDEFSPLAVIEMHLARLHEHIEAQHRLCEKLEAIAVGRRAAETVSVEDLLHLIEEMTMFEKYYAPEQLEQLKVRGQQVGEERIRQVQEEWQKLHAEVQAEVAKGTDPTSETVKTLARRWMALVQEFSGGDPAIEDSLRRMYAQEQTIHGMDVAAMRPMFEYINKAIAALKNAP